LPFTHAAIIGCSVATGVGAVIRHARVAAGESVLVIGCGGVGLNVVQGARLAGARTIIACDLLDNKLAYAKTFGATHTINAKLGDVVKQVQALTDGLGVDAAFDAIGGETTALQAVDAVAPGGRAVLVGIPALSARAPIGLSNMVWAEKTISGTYYGSVRPDIDFPILADLDMDNRLNLDVIEATSIGGRQSDFFATGKLAPGQFGTFATISALLRPKSMSAIPSLLKSHSGH